MAIVEIRASCKEDASEMEGKVYAVNKKNHLLRKHLFVLGGQLGPRADQNLKSPSRAIFHTWHVLNFGSWT